MVFYALDVGARIVAFLSPRPRLVLRSLLRPSLIFGRKKIDKSAESSETKRWSPGWWLYCCHLCAEIIFRLDLFANWVCAWLPLEKRFFVPTFSRRERSKNWESVWLPLEKKDFCANICSRQLFRQSSISAWADSLSPSPTQKCGAKCKI